MSLFSVVCAFLRGKTVAMFLFNSNTQLHDNTGLGIAARKASERFKRDLGITLSQSDRKATHINIGLDRTLEAEAWTITVRDDSNIEIGVSDELGFIYAPLPPQPQGTWYQPPVVLDTPEV